MKLNLVEHIDLVKEPGDAAMVISWHKDTGVEIIQLVISCPGCGKVSGSRGNHIFNKATLTYHPSIVHNKDFGGCGWHGWLKKGIFKEC